MPTMVFGPILLGLCYFGFESKTTKTPLTLEGYRNEKGEFEDITYLLSTRIYPFIVRQILNHTLD